MEENNVVPKGVKTSRILAIVAFTMTFVLMLLALVTDVIILNQAILEFIGTIIAGLFIFLALCIGFVVSIILIFGIVLIKEHGFWPLTLTLKTVKESILKIKIEPSQLEAFKTTRIIIIVLLVAIVIIASIAKRMNKAIVKEGFYEKTGLVRSFSAIAKIFSIVGILFGIGLFFIIGSI